MAALMRRLRRADDQGSELVELAIVLPILILIIGGIIDFGFLFQRYEVVTNAAREGARLAVLANTPAYTEADVQARVQSYLTAAGLDGSVTTTMANSTTTIGSDTIATRTVTVTYPTQFMFIGPTINLQAVSVMRIEGGS